MMSQTNLGLSPYITVVIEHIVVDLLYQVLVMA